MECHLAGKWVSPYMAYINKTKMEVGMVAGPVGMLAGAVVAGTAVKGTAKVASVATSLAVEGAKDTKQDVIWLGAPEAELDYTTLSGKLLGDYQVVLFTSGGPIWVELWPDVAPNHVRNFLDLCSSGFYEGSVFHRVIPGFMAQGGDPTGTGMGGSELPDLKAEFNAEPHVRGTCSMARTLPGSGVVS